MSNLQMGTVETKFAEIIWGNEPLASKELAKLSLEKLGWKKSTTYTVLKRLCDKGIFQNEKGTVTSLISKQEFCSKQTERFVEENFGGSLPSFLAAFTSGKKLSQEEVKQLKKLISEYEEE